MVFLYVYVCDDLMYEVRDRNMIVVLNWRVFIEIDDII